MNIREAILKAADHIEANPNQFDFFSFERPKNEGCGTPGCAMGWIAYFAGEAAVGNGTYHDANSALMLPAAADGAKLFYERMTSFAGSEKAWQLDPKGCSAALRLYADKYHPAEVSKVIRPEAGSWDLIPWQPRARTQRDADQAAMRAQANSSG